MILYKRYYAYKKVFFANIGNIKLHLPQLQKNNAKTKKFLVKK